MNFKFLLCARTFLFSLTLLSIVVAGCGGGTGSALTTASTSRVPAANNSVPIAANFGPNGGGSVNNLYTTVTVCKPSTTTCVTIANVIVDTGSIGLRLVPSALGSVTLNPIASGTNPLEECIQYGDTSLSWGPMQLADVKLGGEVASNIPVQVIGSVTSAIPTSCATGVNPNLPNGGNLDTVAELNANGILGIGDGGVDCGNYCAQTNGFYYYICPNGACAPTLTPVSLQATNPVAAFSSSDWNGVVISLPSVPALGSLSVAGTLTFGINSQADNTMGTPTLYALDQCGDLPAVTLGSYQYTDSSCGISGTSYGGFFDTGTGTLAVSDAATLAASPLSLPISDCLSTSNGYGFYCVSGSGSPAQATLSVTLSGSGVGSGSYNLNIGDGNYLLTNTSNAVFNNLGSDSGTSPSSDFFDFGLPWFLGRTTYLSIGGVAVTNINPATVPYGFVAF